MSFDERPLDDSLLRTGFVPDELQSRPIKAAIVAQRDAIEAIDAQISDLEQRIVDLRRNRQGILDKMSFNEAFLAPIRRVAPEILCEIFGHCLPPEPTQNPTLPLLLMGVCHTWRQIVQETPPLWAQLYVDSTTRMSFVEMFLRNSTIVPLDVTLVLCNEINENATEASDDGNTPLQLAAVNEDQAAMVMETKEIVRVIGEQHRRIRRLSLHTPYSILRTFFPSIFITKTSLLEDLTIYCPDTPRFSSRLRLKGGRLRTLNIDGNTFFATSINRTFGLRRICLQGRVPVSKLLQFLRASPALEELRMENFTPSPLNEPHDINDLDFEPIILTKLSLLEINWAAENYSPVRESPIRYIRTPAVTSVFFKFSNFPRELDDLYDLLTLAAKSIVCLSLERLSGHSYQFFRMVEGLSALEVLYLGDLGFSGMWEILTPEKDSNPTGWVCPRLTNLELCKTDVDERFLEFVRRRTRPIQSETVPSGFHYLESVIINQQYVPRDVSTSLGNLESEREGFFLELRDCRHKRWVG